MSSFIQKVKKGINNPKLIVIAINERGLLRFLSDRQWVKLMYRVRMGKKLNLDNPRTYNEKLQWMKLNYYNPLYTQLADKYEVRKYISNKIGDEYLIPLLGVYDNFDEIDFNELPDQFVIKCNHDSGGLVICRDKSKLDINKARNKIERCLKRNYYKISREWPYKDVKPRIIIEKYMVDESSYELKDYKFYCFDGKSKVMQMITDRGADDGMKLDFFDMEFNHLDMTKVFPNSKKKLKKPEKFEEMIELAEKISEDFPHVRVDLYNINGKLYFGEFTFFSSSGLKPLKPEKWDKIFGDWFKLPEKNR